MREYLATHPCVDCGENDLRLMEFDHVRGQKKAAITVLVNRPSGWKTIEDEIAKCEVRCANCHRIKTCEQQGWYRSLEKQENATQ